MTSRNDYSESSPQSTGKTNSSPDEQRNYETSLNETCSRSGDTMTMANTNNQVANESDAVAYSSDKVADDSDANTDVSERVRSSMEDNDVDEEVLLEEETLSNSDGQDSRECPERITDDHTIDLEMTTTSDCEDSESEKIVVDCLHPCLLRYCCPECKVGFGSDSDLVEHIRQSHVIETPSRCRRCSGFFTNLADNLLHQVSKHRRKYYTCRECQTLFAVAECSPLSRKSTPSSNKDLPDRARDIVCLLCYLSFNFDEELHHHMNQVHGDHKPCKCPVCSKFFTSVSELEEHKLSHKSQVFYTCDECDETFHNSAAFNRHKRAHLRSDVSEKTLPTECEECGKCFLSAELLLRHLDSHTETKQYECRQCGESFKEKASLRKHKRLVHGSDKSEEENKCDQCDEVFPQASQLKRHKSTQHVEKPFECSVCKQTFKVEGYLKKHMIRYHNHEGDKTFQCPDCKKTYPTLANLKRHRRIHTGEKPYKCDVCNRSFSDQSNLVAHKKRGVCANRPAQTSPPDDVSKPYTCNTCGKSFSQHNNLVRHERIHSGEKPFKCALCEKPFADRSYLIKHCRLEHGIEISTRVALKNDTVSVQTGNDNDLREDGIVDVLQRDVNGEKHACEQCGKKFRMASQLKRHVQTHGQKTLQCNECGKFMTSLGNLKAHQRVHTGEKPYQCESCGNRFARLSTLVYHKRTHTGEKPHKCDTCGRGFSVSSALIKHKRSIHAGEKPYQCNHCGKFFSRTSNLKKHLRTHTGERPYQCEQCGRRFREKNHLTTHIRLIHNSDRAVKGDSGKSGVSDQHRRHHLSSPNSAAESLLALSRDDSVSAPLYATRRDDQMSVPPAHSSRQDLINASMSASRDSQLASMHAQQQQQQQLHQRRDESGIVAATSLHHVQLRDDAMVMVTSMHGQRRDEPMTAAAFFPPRRDDPMAASLLAQRRTDSIMYPNPDIPLMLLKDVPYS